MIILAVESSCDETSVAILENGNKVLSNVVVSQIDIHKLYGGVVPEIASRNHIKVICEVFDKAIADAKIKKEDISLVAVTSGPGLIGSLIVGIVAANSFAISNNLPIIGCDHLKGHLYASFLSSIPKFPAIALLISGGHTELIYAKSIEKFKIIGKTKDDSIGESYDKVARVLGLDYPGGPIIDRLAKDGSDTYNLPKMLVKSTDYDFSYSGLKSAVINKVHNLKEKNIEINIKDMAKSFQETALELIIRKVKKALTDYKVKNLIIGGGVSANKRLREILENEFTNYNIYIPEFKYCTDNAAMIAVAAYYKYQNLSKKEKKELKTYLIKPYSTK